MVQLIERAGFPYSGRELALIPPNTNDPNGYYKDFGVPPHASPEQIKRKYREWMREVHPDGNNPDQFTHNYMQHIFEVLSDPDERHRYNQSEDVYISDWEKREIWDDLVDLGLVKDSDKSEVLSEEEEIEEDFWSDLVDEMTQALSQWSFYSDSFDSCTEKALDWYEPVLEACKALGVKSEVRIGVRESPGVPVTVLALRSGRVVLWFDEKAEPSWPLALMAVSDWVHLMSQR